MKKGFFRSERGVGLLETVIAVGVFAIIAIAALRAYVGVLDLFTSSALRTTAADLANEQFEIMRNMRYEEVGVAGGIPSGPIPATQTFVRGGDRFLATTTIRNIDDPFDGTLGGAPNDTAPADYKLAEIEIQCLTCRELTRLRFTGRIAPPGLEGASTNGALFTQVIDASGLPISGAFVRVTNSTTTPAIDLSDITGADGFLRLVDFPPSLQSYNVYVSKDDYSSDQTRAASPQNPNPLVPPLSVVQGGVTQVTFAIDRTSSLVVRSVTETCATVHDINFTLTGSKLIGTNPDVPKVNWQRSTGGQGSVGIDALEWDVYSFAFPGNSVDVGGTIPDLPLTVIPGVDYTLTLVGKTLAPNAALIAVRDSVSGLPVAGAEVTLAKGSFTATSTTGRGSVAQTDWSGGPGETNFASNPSAYYQDDGGVSGAAAGSVQLALLATSTYASSGSLTSATIDAGSPSAFYALSWEPSSQPPQTGANPVRMQIATATTSNPAVWNYLGPDGTAATYYTSPTSNIPAIHTNDRYLRYRLLLQTASTTYTPTVDQVGITFASDCVPPGQVFVNNLSYGTYAIGVTKDGYQTASSSLVLDNPWEFTSVELSPQ